MISHRVFTLRVPSVGAGVLTSLRRLELRRVEVASLEKRQLELVSDPQSGCNHLNRISECESQSKQNAVHTQPDEVCLSALSFLKTEWMNH